MPQANQIAVSREAQEISAGTAAVGRGHHRKPDCGSISTSASGIWRPWLSGMAVFRFIR